MVTDKYNVLNPEVLFTATALTSVERRDISDFKQLAARNPRKRVRLCTHDSAADSLHEMLIVHEHSAYVRPHKHPGKTESAHIIEGRADLVLFDDGGRIDGVIRMGDYGSGATFYYRMSEPKFHTLIIRSDVVVFHEVTNGPFDRSDTVFASWAPQDIEISAVRDYLADLHSRLAAVPSAPAG